MGGAEVLLMLGLTAVVVLSMVALVIRVDPAGRMLERRIRRGTAELLAEADRARR